MSNITNKKIFDNEIKQLAQGVYKGNEKFLAKDWIVLSEYQNNKTGFYGQAYYKDGKVVLSFRGTEPGNINDLKNDAQMALNNLPSQYFDAQNFYEEIKKDFPNQKIIFTGHSLGGSLAQLMGNKTGCETITFNAYGVGDLIPQNEINDNNIRNYGNINDTVFNINLNNQLGKIYITGSDKNTEYITKDSQIDYIGGLDPYFHHLIENMGNIEDAVEYFPKLLEGKVEVNVNNENINSYHTFTREEIDKMSIEEYQKNEKAIMKQLKEKGIPTDQELKLERSKAKNYSNEDGKWVTINGNHVFIED